MRKKERILRLAGYVKNIWWIYIPTLLFFAAQNMFMTLSVSYVQKKAVDLLGDTFSGSAVRALAGILAGYILAVLILFIFAGLIDYLNLYIGNSIKEDLFRSYLAFPLHLTPRGKALGDMNAKLISDCSNISGFLTYQLGLFFMPVLQIAGCIFSLWHYSVLLGAGAALAAALSLAYNQWAVPKVRKLSKKLQENNGKFMGRLGFLLDAAETIRTYRLEDVQEKETSAVIMLSKKLKLKSFYYETARSVIGNVVHCIYVSAAIGYAVYLYARGELPLSVLTVIPTLAGGALSGVMDLCTTSFGVQPMISSMERVFGVMDENPKGEFGTECVPPTIQGEAEGMDAVILENVSFRYNNGSGFENVSVRVPERCYFAIRGNVGAGKSTLFKVLLGLERKRTGKIQVLSREQDETESFQWLSCFTYVEQEQQLFRTTVRENILLAEAWDEERFLYVCRVTGLEELLKKLPDGMDTVIEDQNRNLSGGQRQLICFLDSRKRDDEILIMQF